MSIFSSYSRSSSISSAITEPLLLDFYSSSSSSSSDSEQDDDRSQHSLSPPPTSPSTPAPPPPDYAYVLLEAHLSLAKRHAALYPADLLAAVRGFLRDDPHPPPHPYRTYHALEDRPFTDGRGSYRGELDHKSRRNGFGHMLYDTGDSYQGFWKKGVREGEGAFFWADTGSLYQGEWKGGERNGRGHFVFGPRRGDLVGDGGLIFTGLWSEGKIRGHGTVSYVSEEDTVVKAKEVFGVSDSEGNGLVRLVRRLTVS